MKAFAGILALIVATPVVAQSDGPYKLVITYYESIVVADYPTRVRCERAMRAVNERMAAKAVRSGLPPVSGEIAFCIPG